MTTHVLLLLEKIANTRSIPPLRATAHSRCISTWTLNSGFSTAPPHLTLFQSPQLGEWHLLLRSCQKPSCQWRGSPLGSNRLQAHHGLMAPEWFSLLHFPKWALFLLFLTPSPVRLVGMFWSCEVPHTHSLVLSWVRLRAVPDGPRQSANPTVSPKVPLILASTCPWYTPPHPQSTLGSPNIHTIHSASRGLHRAGSLAYRVVLHQSLLRAACAFSLGLF
jgi:hypothetical protein